MSKFHNKRINCYGETFAKEHKTFIHSFSLFSAKVTFVMQDLCLRKWENGISVKHSYYVSFDAECLNVLRNFAEIPYYLAADIFEDNNSMEGSIPSELGNLSFLETLWLGTY